MADFVLVKLLDKMQIVNIPDGLVPMGAYDTGINYAVGDSVDFLGSSYVMYADAPAGTTPTNTTYWQVLADKGDKGDKGDTGAAGGTGLELIITPDEDAADIFRVNNAAGVQMLSINTLGGWVNVGPDQPAFNQDTNIALYIVKSVDSYSGINIINPNTGNSASADMVVVNDDVDQATYADVGITSTTFNDQNYTIFGVSTGYVMGSEVDLVIVSTKATGKIYFGTGGSLAENKRMVLDDVGNLGIGEMSPTAKLHIAAGTANANTAPIKLTAGVVNTTPEAGTIEFDGTDLFICI
jgi:hypothetical protein